MKFLARALGTPWRTLNYGGAKLALAPLMAVYPRNPSEVADRLILAVQLNPPVPAWAGRDLAALVAELRRVGSPAPVRPLDAPPRWAPQFFALAGDPREALG